MATGASITITVDDAAVAAMVARVKARLADLTPLMDAIGAALLTATQQRFEREAGPDGRPWAKLRPRTAAERARAGYVPINILRRTGMLYQSLTYLPSATAVTVGTNNPYAAIHQFGGEINQAARTQTIYQRFNPKTGDFDPKFVKKRKSTFARDVTIPARTIRIPARPYLGLSDEDRREILAVGEDVLRDAIGGAP